MPTSPPSTPSSALLPLSSTERPVTRAPSPSPLFNLSGEEAGVYLKALEEAEALEQLPVLVLLGVMSLVGNLGNGVALYVYYTRFTPSSTRCYILAMSVLDLLFCSVTLPGEILDLRFPLTYSARSLCRLHRFISVTLNICSAMTLVAVALDRRRKICYPFRPQLTSRQVSCSVIGCLAASVVLGLPFGVMNGKHSVKTEVEGVVGSACSVDDDYIDTSFPLIYNAILLLIFLACVTAMTLSYAQIARKIVKHKRRSVAGSGGAAARGLALLMAKHPPGQERDSSSHFEGHAHLGQRPSQAADSSCQVSGQMVEYSRVDDDVFTSQTEPVENSRPKQAEESGKHGSGSEPSSAACSAQKKAGKGFKSQSLKKREEEFDMAVRTLVHAVSEDMLHCSELFSSPAPHRPRSASLAETSLTLHRGAPPHHAPNTLMPTSPKLTNDVNNTCDVAVVMTSSESYAHNQNSGNEKDCKTGHEEKASEISEEKERKPNREVGKGVARNTSLKSQLDSRSGRKSDDDPIKHVTISESHAERLQSLVHNTLSRIKPRSHSKQDDVTSTSSMRRRQRGKKIPSRTTWMMFVLTAIFIISFLPYLTIVCVRATYHNIETGLHGWRLNLYTLGLKSYFINSIVNPFVYSFCSARFRHQCRHLFRRRPKMSISD